MADPKELLSHVQDAKAFHIVRGWEIPIPQPFKAMGIDITITKFMVVELVAALLMIAVFVPLARRLRDGNCAPRPFGEFFRGDARVRSR